MKSLLLLLGLATSAFDDAFQDTFDGSTMRYDYYHSGTAGEEHVSRHQVRVEGAWTGAHQHLLDPTDLGKYRFQILDEESGRPLYSRGFASIYGEWETTGEARDRWRTFHESQRFPAPRAPFLFVLEKRARDGTFQELHRDRVDPAGRFVDRAPPTRVGTVHEIEVNGPPERSVDLLILAEGYTAAQRDKFVADATRLSEVLLTTEPFAARRRSFNVRGLHVAAAEPGISNPRQGKWVNAPFGCRFNAFDSDRYVLTENNLFLREAAAQAPYDALLILFNDRKYGGGGIFNLWTTCSADTAPADYVFVHEFGHSFAGLADEYYTSQVAYEDFTEEGVEPWEPNVTALLDPARLKWRDLVGPDTPLPTPWNQAAYDEASHAYQEERTKLREAGASEEEMEALFARVKAVTEPMLQGEEYAGRVGAFEGGGYQAKGLYRPAVDCIMFTRNPKDFCAVCRRALDQVIELYLSDAP